MLPTDLVNAIRALLEAIEVDEHRSGGLLSRTTHRKAAELRLVLARMLVPPGPNDEGESP